MRALYRGPTHRAVGVARSERAEGPSGPARQGLARRRSGSLEAHRFVAQVLASRKEATMTELHRGRLIDHLQLVVRDVEASKRFYRATLGALGIPIELEGPDYFGADELFVSSKSSKAAAGELTGRTHLAFQAASRAIVEKFHREGLAAGGKDNGKPGERAYHPGYYAAFLLDPDGNNVEAVFHGEAERSAPSVKITF
jgi:catechol 2,3-dioxygenase-like lactoylglutathione lyase family enzyme